MPSFNAAHRFTRTMRAACTLVLVALAAALPASPRATAADSGWELTGPPGSGAFGTGVEVLNTGNIVVLDPSYDTAAAANVGAVYLYNGATHALISALTGSSADDQIGSHGITSLANGSFLVLSPNWDNGPAVDAGAVTWINGAAGQSGTVSNTNSLVGASSGDQIGAGALIYLRDSDTYVLGSPGWDNGIAVDAGAVTRIDGATGLSGAVSAANSLVGTNIGDQVGSKVTRMYNTSYVVRSPNWDNGTLADAGAVTWVDGQSSLSGAVSAANSLVGATAGDNVGSGGVIALFNGNYLVLSPNWDNDAAANAGAVTWVDGATGLSGAVSAANSLVGTNIGDQVGSNVTQLYNTSYVLRSPSWDNGAAIDAGAVTWGDGLSSLSGAVSAANSLVGATPGDQVGSGGVSTLSNGNYLVRSPKWDNGGADAAGAVTFGSAASGVSGVVSAANSLVGSTAGDQVGSGGVSNLSNGNYVVRSPNWDNGGAADAGAATWGAPGGVSGVVAPTNSLVGTTAGDQVGNAGIVKLIGGESYAVRSPNWDNGGLVDAGAITWATSATGISGAVSATNSLVGASTGDSVGSGITMLTSGRYVAVTPNWDNGGLADVGAVTWVGDPATTSGAVSAANSLIGATPGDQVGSSGVTRLEDGNYVVSSPQWHNGGAANAGAVTWGAEASGVSGTVSAANSLVGASAGDNVGGEWIRLTSANYLVLSPNWHNGGAADAGALTVGSDASGVRGVVSAANSIVGTTAGDQVGSSVASWYDDDRYQVLSPNWDNGSVVDAGAVTVGSFASGTVGAVSAANSLVGATAGDNVGAGDVELLDNGVLVISVPVWDNGGLADAGAVSIAGAGESLNGPVSTANSVVGQHAQVGPTMAVNHAIDYTGILNETDIPPSTLVIAFPGENRVILRSYPGQYKLSIPAIRR